MTRVKGFCHRSKHFTDTGSLCSGQAYGPDHLLRGKLEQLTDGCGSSEDSCGRCNVPAGIVVCRINSVSDARFRFESHDEGVEKLSPSCAVCACIREQCRRDRRGWMDVIHRRRVVVFIHMAADAVDHRGEKRIEPLPTRKQVCRGLTGKRRKCAYCCVHCRLPAAADRASNEIQQSTLRFVYNIAGNLF